MAFQTTPTPSAIATSLSSTSGWEKLRTQPPSLPQVVPAAWVHLLNPPTAYSFDEAWLLCQVDEDHWLAWVPDYGEILLHVTEFYVGG